MTDNSSSITMLNSMPVIVDAPGLYQTRDRNLVTVHEINPPHETSDMTVTQNAVKGNKWKMFRGKYRPRTFGIWHVSGRKFVFRESPSDIMSKATPEQIALIQEKAET
jgi:hypothetical protein